MTHEPTPLPLLPVEVDDPRRIFERVPFIRHVGLERDFSEGGRARLSLAPRPELGNVVGAIHGGAVLTLIDVAMASATVSAEDFKRTAVTLDLHTVFVQPGRGTLVAEAAVLRAADGIAWCEAEVRDEAGQLVARGQGSFRYLPLPYGQGLPRPSDPQDVAADAAAGSAAGNAGAAR